MIADASTLQPGIVVVSSGFRHRPTVVFGVIAYDDEVKDGEAGGLVGERANLVGFGAKRAKEAFQEVGRADQVMELLVQGVKG